MRNLNEVKEQGTENCEVLLVKKEDVKWVKRKLYIAKK